MSDRSTSPLRQKMIRVLQLHRKADSTIDAYVNAVELLSKHYQRSPDQISIDQVRDFIHFLITERKLAYSTCNQRIAGINFFYRHVLGQTNFHLRIPIKRSGRLPEPLSRSEISHLIAAATNLKHRALMMTVYGAGLRVSELVRLRPENIHADRMLIRIDCSKGHKDRYTLLSPRMLRELRQYWQAYRPSGWLFTNRDGTGPLPAGTAQGAFDHLKRRAKIVHGHGIHSLRHSFGTHLMEARVPLRHRKVMRAIVSCRTAALGGHRQWCQRCDLERYVYHSCRNRHCPKCQTQAKEAWRQARRLELLPVPYFHQVFTLPHQFNAWMLAGEGNQRALLKLLFDSAASTLLEFGRGELGGQVGFTLVLHTWDQQLRPHYHLHGLIAAGALSSDGNHWIAGGAKFLFPVRALSKLFRGKFIAGFAQLLAEDKLRLPLKYADRKRDPHSMLRKLRKKPWVVYSKAPFAGPAKLLDYLSRYTHRVAIANHRLVSCLDGQVSFRYRDRTDGDRRKTNTLPVDQFIGRFLTHVLPDQFRRIRHYGFLSNRYRKRKLATIRKLLGARAPEPLPVQTAEQWLQSVLGIDPGCCPGCGERLQERELRPAVAAMARPAANFQQRGPPERTDT